MSTPDFTSAETDALIRAAAPNEVRGYIVSASATVQETTARLDAYTGEATEAIRAQRRRVSDAIGTYGDAAKAYLADEDDDAARKACVKACVWLVLECCKLLAMIGHGGPPEAVEALEEGRLSHGT